MLPSQPANKGGRPSGSTKLAKTASQLGQRKITDFQNRAMDGQQQQQMINSLQAMMAQQSAAGGTGQHQNMLAAMMPALAHAGNAGGFPMFPSMASGPGDQAHIPASAGIGNQLQSVMAGMMLAGMCAGFGGMANQQGQTPSAEQPPSRKNKAVPSAFEGPPMNQKFWGERDYDNMFDDNHKTFPTSYRAFGGLWKRNPRIVVPRQLKQSALYSWSPTKFTKIVLNNCCDDQIDELMKIVFGIDPGAKPNLLQANTRIQFRKWCVVEGDRLFSGNPSRLDHLAADLSNTASLAAELQYPVDEMEPSRRHFRNGQPMGMASSSTTPFPDATSREVGQHSPGNDKPQCPKPSGDLQTADDENEKQQWWDDEDWENKDEEWGKQAESSSDSEEGGTGKIDAVALYHQLMAGLKTDADPSASGWKRKAPRSQTDKQTGKDDDEPTRSKDAATSSPKPAPKIKYSRKTAAKDIAAAKAASKVAKGISLQELEKLAAQAAKFKQKKAGQVKIIKK